MKKTAWICIISLTIGMLMSCSRQIEQLPHGLMRKTSDEKGETSEGEGKEFQKYQLTEYDGEDETHYISQKVVLYFLDEANNRLMPETQTISLSNISSILNGVVTALIKGPKGENLKSPISSNTKVIKIEQIDNIVTLDLSSEFLESENPLAARVALVNTLTEHEEVKYVKIFVEGVELTVDRTQGKEAVGLLNKYPNNLDELAAVEKREDCPEKVKQINRELYFSDFRNKYLLAQVRAISVKDGEIARAIVEELIKGPINAETGLYPVMPQGTRLLDINLIQDKDQELGTIALYFSKEFKTVFANEKNLGGLKEQDHRYQGNKDKESIMLSSLVYSLTALPNVGSVKIFYQNDDGDYVDLPLYSINLKAPLKVEDFAEKIGRRLKIYFGEPSAMNLVPDYRAMARDNLQIATTIINELILGPREGTGHISVIPPGIVKGDIRVWMDEADTTVMVDLPSKLDGNSMGSAGELMTLYAIVNSLTDPANTTNIKQVKFLVDGKIQETFGNMEISEPFIRNPAIIQD